MAAIFTAADVTSLASSVQTLMVAGVGVILIFVAYRMVKKGLGRL